MAKISNIRKMEKAFEVLYEIVSEPAQRAGVDVTLTVGFQNKKGTITRRVKPKGLAAWKLADGEDISICECHGMNICRMHVELFEERQKNADTHTG